jgi:hypothetical protein
MVAAAYKPLAAKEAKERQVEAVRRGNVTRHQDSPEVAQTPPLEQGKARDIAAQKSEELLAKLHLERLDDVPSARAEQVIRRLGELARERANAQP